jgi:hypothetical protein
MAPFWRENQLNGTQKTKKNSKERERAHDLENQDASEDPRQGFNSRDSICFK